MKLYYAPGSCSLSPHIVLRETGLDFELDRIDIRTRQTESGVDYRTINPNGYIPALELDNGEILLEGPAIVQYLADLKPEANLIPKAGTINRYRVQSWLNYVASELHKKFGPLVIPGTPDEAKQKASEDIQQRLELARDRLADNDYLVGNQFSVADVYLYVIVMWIGMFGMDAASWPELEAFKGRIEQRPAVAAAREAEGLS